MPVSKPTKYPDFAMTDVNDPTSGQPNVIEPSSGKKSDGWVYNEKPPRQYLNWLARLTSQWVRWIDDYLTNTVAAHIAAVGNAVHGLGTASTHASTDFDASGSASAVQSNLDTTNGNVSTLQGYFTSGTFVGRLHDGVGGNIDITFNWKKIFNVVTISWLDIDIPANRRGGPGIGFENTGTDDMPPAIKPTTNGIYHVIGQTLDGTIYQFGKMTIYTIAFPSIQMFIDKQGISTYFDQTKHNVIYAGSVTYSV